MPLCIPTVSEPKWSEFQSLRRSTCQLEPGLWRHRGMEVLEGLWLLWQLAQSLSMAQLTSQDEDSEEEEGQITIATSRAIADRTVAH